MTRSVDLSRSLPFAALPLAIWLTLFAVLPAGWFYYRSVLILVTVLIWGSYGGWVYYRWWFESQGWYRRYTAYFPGPAVIIGALLSLPFIAYHFVVPFSGGPDVDLYCQQHGGGAPVCAARGFKDQYISKREVYREIRVILRDFHGGLLISNEELKKIVPKLRLRFAGRAPLLEIAWGEKSYYSDPHLNLQDLINVALRDSEAVLAISGIKGGIGKQFEASQRVNIYQFTVTEAGYERLKLALREEFNKDPRRKVVKPEFVETLAYGKRGLFQGQGRYRMPRTSNTWLAELLKRAGLPVRPQYVVTRPHLEA